MTGVLWRTNRVKQPRGGYLKTRDMEIVHLENLTTLHNQQDPHVNLKTIALAVDYLTHLFLGFDKREIFATSLIGAGMIDEVEHAQKLLDEINDLDSQSIINTCKIVGYDGVFRRGKYPFVPVEEIKPTEETVEDIRTMVHRSLNFFENKKPIIKNNVKFKEGYTNTIRTGEVDFLTNDELWDLQILKHGLQEEDSLQILVYYLLGLRSVHKEHFKKVKIIGIYNPRLNISYSIHVKDLSEELIEEVYEKVISH